MYTSGDIIAPQYKFADTGIGFYINATRNKESDPLEALWTRNNLYVLHNKIYYRAEAGGGSPAPKHNGQVVYVPVNFGDEDENQQPEPQSDQSGANQAVKRLINGQIIIFRNGERYDITGRKL